VSVLTSAAEREALVAPCGMDCAYCSRYLDHVYGRATGCEGCLPRHKECRFLKGRCVYLDGGLVRSCAECSSFPCAQIHKLDVRYQRKGWDVDFSGNIHEIRMIGLDQFTAESDRRHSCAACGGPVTVHGGTCYGCGRVWAQPGATG